MGVLHIQRSGFFPFCIVPATNIWAGGGFPGPTEVGPGTFYPVGVDLATAMRWYWKVKTWHLTSDAVLSGVQSDPPYAFSVGAPADTDIPSKDEQAKLVCPGGLAFGADPVIFTLFTPTTPVLKLDGLYYPSLRVRIQVDGLTLSTFRSDVTYPKVWPNDGAIDSVALPLFYDESPSYDGTGGVPGDHGPWTQAATGSIAVTVADTF